MSNCQKDYAFDTAEQYMKYANYVTSAALFAAKKFAPVNDLAKALGIAASPAGLSTQAAVSMLGIAKNEATPIVGGLSISGPTLAMFAKIGSVVATGAVIAGSTVAAPVSTIALGLTVATVIVAAAGNETVRDILTDPELWKGGVDGIDDYFRNKGVGLDDVLKALADAVTTGTFDLQPEKLPSSECDWHDYKNANRDGKYHIVDPLVLDLDGDGIETVGTQGYHGALFDHNKDGIRTATGWVSADDGLLVIDRNSDGLINNGNELFGDSTALKDGNNAAHGYAALKELDTNSDGLIDAQDEAFKQLRVWRDLNQDGISQEGELFTLESLNIQSLNTAYQDVDTRLGNGNSLVQKGSYTLSDGQTREMGDVLLANDTLHSRYIDKVNLTAEQAQTANLQGIGRLRDLREAAALSPKLAA